MRAMPRFWAALLALKHGRVPGDRLLGIRRRAKIPPLKAEEFIGRGIKAEVAAIANNDAGRLRTDFNNECAGHRFAVADIVGAPLISEYFWKPLSMENRDQQHERIANRIDRPWALGGPSPKKPTDRDNIKISIPLEDLAPQYA